MNGTLVGMNSLSPPQVHDIFLEHGCKGKPDVVVSTFTLKTTNFLNIDEPFHLGFAKTKGVPRTIHKYNYTK